MSEQALTQTQERVKKLQEWAKRVILTDKDNKVVALSDLNKAFIVIPTNNMEVSLTQVAEEKVLFTEFFEQLTRNLAIALIADGVTNDDLIRMADDLSMKGGCVVPSSECSVMEIALARVENRFYLKDSLGYVRRPKEWLEKIKEMLGSKMWMS